MKATAAPHHKNFAKWLLVSLFSVIATFMMFAGGPAKPTLAATDISTMQWGLLPATDPKPGSTTPTYSMMWGSAVDSRDFNPAPDDETNSIVTTGDNANSLTKPYVVGTKSPTVVTGDPHDWESQSTAKVGDTVSMPDGSSFKVTGFRIAADTSKMYDAGIEEYDERSYGAEKPYFNFDVQEVTQDGKPVSGSGLTTANLSESTNSTILGFDKMKDPDNDLAKVTITSANDQYFVGTQVLYFSLKGTNTPKPKPQPSNFGYGFIQPNGNVGMTDMKPNTKETPITVTIPDDGTMFISDLNNQKATWASDNDKLTLAKEPNDGGYRVTGLKTLAAGTIVKFTITQVDGTTSDFYFKFNVANGGGGNGGGGNNNGGGGSSTITTPTTPTQPATPAPTTPTPPAKHETNSSSPSAPEIKLPNYASVKNSAVYAVNPIYMYKHATFKKSQRIAKYPKATRVNRPMFVITGYARSNNGALRYKVRDVNHGKKTAGKIGYITANPKYVLNVYYKTMPKNKKITVIAKSVHAYKNQSLTGRTKTYKKGTHLTVKKLVKHNLTTRYQLSNGYYVTANKKLVIQGNY